MFTEESQKISNNQNCYIPTQKAADMLNVSVPTIYNYIREKKLKPVYEDKWRIDRSLLFREEDIMKLQKELKKPGLTRSEVAKKLDVSPSTVTNYFKKGTLPFFIQQYKGRNLYFVKEEDLSEFIEQNDSNKKRHMKQFFNKELSVYLYQRYFNKDTNEMARVMELRNGQGKVMTENGEVFTINDLLKKEFKPFENIEDKEYITRKGVATFTFQRPKFINSPIFNLIELFYQHLGPKNIRMAYDDNQIYLEIKPIVIEVENTELFETEINLLQQNLVEGQVSSRHNAILIESDLEPMIIHLPRNFKNKIVSEAIRRGLTIEEYAVKLLKQGMETEE